MILSSGLRSRAALLHNTIRFHIRNGIGCACNSRGTVSIGLWIDRDRPITLTVRPFAGDLFVLYEVLAFKAYHISSALLPADNVRVIVDCGANIGITSLFPAARYPRAKILSVEPHPENFALLKTNVEAVSRILPIRACVMGTPQSAVRFTADQAAWGNRIAADSNGMLVPAITIDELCEQNGIETIDLLKLDIEGAEAQILEKGSFSLAQNTSLWSCTGTMGLNALGGISPLTDCWRERSHHQTHIW